MNETQRELEAMYMYPVNKKQFNYAEKKLLKLQSIANSK